MNRPKIVNCYHKECFSGIGDFLRGSIYLYKKCKENGIDFSISLNNHTISKYLKFKEEESCDLNLIKDIPIDFSYSDKKIGLNKFLISELDKIFYVLKNMRGGEKFIFCNYHKVMESDHISIMNFINSIRLDKDVCYWFNENIYFSESIEDAFDSSLIPDDFNVLHFRLGDKYSFSNGSDKDDFDKDYFFSIINRQEKKDTVIISDNNNLKRVIMENKEQFPFPIFIPHFKSSHTQKHTGVDWLEVNNDSDFFSAFDLKILSKASKVVGYSSYYWGTGFSCWVSKLLSIPFSCKPFMKDNILYKFN